MAKGRASGAGGASDAAEQALSAERARIEAAQRERVRFAELYENNFERVYAYVARGCATAPAAIARRRKT